MAVPNYSRAGMFFKELKQMELKENNFIKEHNSFVLANTKKGELLEELNEISAFDKELLDRRKHERTVMKQQLHKIRHASRTFSQEVKDVEQPDQHFINRVKSLMEDVEKSIRSFKENEQEKYEVLIADERSLLIDVTALEKKMEAWSRGHQDDETGAVSAPTKSAATARDVIKDLPPEVAAFERFLTQNGGHSGGWDDFDQRAFMRIRTKHKGKPAFLDELIARLPTKTPEQCRQHEEWYKEYCLLLERKKMAIDNWKAKKAEAREFVEDEEVKPTKEKLEDPMKDRERAIKKLQVDAWKVQKEIERRKKEAEEDNEKQKERRAEEVKKEKLREKTRQQVAAYKMQKQTDYEEELMLNALRDEEMKLGCKPSAAEQRRIAARNAKMVEEKLARKRLVEEEERLKEERLERLKEPVTVRSARDFNRLVQPTAGWRERLRANAEEAVQGGGGGGVVVGARNMPGRAVPSWRQGVH